MTIKERISYFSKLGDFLNNFKAEDTSALNLSEIDRKYFDQLEKKVNSAVHHNGWFTKENVLFSLDQWSKALSSGNLERWLSPYDFPEEQTPKTIAIIMAGNIPLVGFHDFLSVLISGNNVLIKQSDNDKQLLPLICAYLTELNSEFESKIRITKDRLEDFDAVIATGSNNTARYFEYYFKNKPNIIRKNRNSVAIITGEESKEELKLLSEDIFRYYGLGCRNVSKLFLPRNYDFDHFFKGIFHWNDIINQNKYANNYDYNKAVYLMSQFNILDNGFLMLKEDENYGSPISVLFYEYYDDQNQLQQHLEEEAEKLQCVVRKEASVKNEVKFGETQHPKLWDYADGVDTIQFLINLN
ncbi:acyl-CoA reductase [Zunongwangia endophytica]|uniref:Acyl-CoA reductase n=1 Tax=Zunongwangia endophytica TaxID=1808945 RepID=A0ABV8H1T5_9FLAO|nr:acyl-CoA reductase [Zunongwangia endophytica]MDN3594276.1 acyl-CoA reductase [Zunongwangia endophytica]